MLNVRYRYGQSFLLPVNFVHNCAPLLRAYGDGGNRQIGAVTPEIVGGVASSSSEMAIGHEGSMWDAYLADHSSDWLRICRVYCKLPMEVKSFVRFLFFFFFPTMTYDRGWSPSWQQHSLNHFLFGNLSTKQKHNVCFVAAMLNTELNYRAFILECCEKANSVDYKILIADKSGRMNTKYVFFPNFTLHRRLCTQTIKSVSIL